MEQRISATCDPSYSGSVNKGPRDGWLAQAGDHSNAAPKRSARGR